MKTDGYLGIKDVLVDFWKSGPFYDGGGKYDKQTADVAKETGSTYDEAHRARETATKDMAKSGFFKPGPPSKDESGKV